jgi:hypothetical protein
MIEPCALETRMVRTREALLKGVEWNPINTGEEN